MIDQIQFSVVEQPKVGTDDCLNLSTDNYWLLIAATQLVVKSMLVQRSQVERSLSPIFQILSEMQENRWEHERSSKTGYVTIWEDWTDSWIREGHLLYLRSPAKRFRRKQICPHTELCLVEDLNSLLLETSHRSGLWIVLWIVMYRLKSLLSQHVASQPNLEVESRWNHHLPLYLLISINPIKSRGSWLCWLRALQPWEEILHQMSYHFRELMRRTGWAARELANGRPL